KVPVFVKNVWPAKLLNNPVSYKFFQKSRISGLFCYLPVIVDKSARFFAHTYYLCYLIIYTMTTPVLLGMLGTNEIIIILIIVLLLFGGKKIPELMRGLGKGVREFNDAKTNVKKEIEESAGDVKNSVK
ncbi:MAG TPA: twin-arginine translocase TatA/TatE family subunit, partial [Chitinophagaceae bacterium]|nr:twin-arginine translocase TatA/TatE family subunit [Chitinophagaceae bacterium]